MAEHIQINLSVAESALAILQQRIAKLTNFDVVVGLLWGSCSDLPGERLGRV